MQHGVEGKQAHALAARGGQDVDEVDAVVAHDLFQSDLGGGRLR